MIERQEDLTPAVLAVMRRTADPRLREIMVSLVTHLHAFVREVRLTEAEFRDAAAIVNEIGKLTTDTHNEAVLMAGSLASPRSFACSTTATTARPRRRSPCSDRSGACTRRGGKRRQDCSVATPGPPCSCPAASQDRQGRPVAGAEVDIWHVLDGGSLREPGPDQADMNLRGKFTTDQMGGSAFRSHQAGRLPDPDQRPGRRSAAGAGPPPHPAGAYACPDLQAGLQDPHLAGLCPRRSQSSRPTCSSASRAR